MTSLLNVVPSNPHGTLKSSSSYAQKSFDAKPVDRALHEASERFVETMPDSRITFFSSPEHLERRVKKEKGYFLKGKGRVGYLLCMPKRPLLWIDEQKKQCIRIGARVAKSLSEDTSVFIATFDKYDGLLCVDDCWIYKGKSLVTLPFTQRWEYVLKMYAYDYKPDTFLQSGLSIQPATYYPLSAFQSVAANEEWIHWMPEDASQKRLRVQLKPKAASGASCNETSAPAVARKPEHSRPASSSGKLPITPSPVSASASSAVPTKIHKHKKPVEATAHLTAKAVPHESFPDTYTLFTAEENEKGIAAIQKFALSQKLKAVFEKEKKECAYVRVAWNTDFEKWQIMDLAPSEEWVASPDSQWVP
jgi:hypothetical protein